MECPARSQAVEKMHEDLEFRILQERMRLLQSQRELAALRCQRFTEMLEATLATACGSAAGCGAASEREAEAAAEPTEDSSYWSCPGGTPEAEPTLVQCRSCRGASQGVQAVARRAQKERRRRAIQRRANSADHFEGYYC